MILYIKTMKKIYITIITIFLLNTLAFAKPADPRELFEEKNLKDGKFAELEFFIPYERVREKPALITHSWVDGTARETSRGFFSVSGTVYSKTYVGTKKIRNPKKEYEKLEILGTVQYKNRTYLLTSIECVYQNEIVGTVGILLKREDFENFNKYVAHASSYSETNGFVGKVVRGNIAEIKTLKDGKEIIQYTYLISRY